MIYTEQELFEFMAESRPVKVTSTSGKVYVGVCVAYSSVTNEVDFGINQPSIEVQDTILYSDEIKTIEYDG